MARGLCDAPSRTPPSPNRVSTGEATGASTGEGGVLARGLGDAPSQPSVLSNRVTAAAMAAGGMTGGRASTGEGGGRLGRRGRCGDGSEEPSPDK